MGAGLESGAQPGVDALTHLLLALVVVIAIARVFGAAFRRMGQPPVMGEIVAGIVLGPSLLGRLAPDASAFLFPATVIPSLAVFAQIGVILYMFLIGLQMDGRVLRERASAFAGIALASILAPFALGAALSLPLHPHLSPAGVPKTVFALFLGVSMSVTAFPVLARILADLKLQETRIGVLALSCAAAGDVVAWCLLAVVVGVARSEPGGVLETLGLAAVFSTFMVTIVRRAAGRVAAHRAAHRERSRETLAIAGVAILLSALATQAIGIHALFGAFLLGAVVPRDSALARDLLDRLEDLVVLFLLPLFFASAGLHTEIGLVRGLEGWLVLVLIVLVASVGKIGGALVGARAAGFDWREAFGLGVLMNTRGLMELIVLEVGLDLGILTPTLFAMLVLMAIATTLATAPLLKALGWHRRAPGFPGPGQAEDRGPRSK